MKEIVIKMTEEDFHNIQIGCAYRVEDDATLGAIRNGTLLPKNLTNGDAIKSIYPNADIKVLESLDSVNVVTDQKQNAQTFDIDWWNAPYEGIANET